MFELVGRVNNLGLRVRSFDVVLEAPVHGYCRLKYPQGLSYLGGEFMVERSELDRYWSRRGKDYLGEFDRHDSATRRVFKHQEKVLLDFLRNHVQFKSVLEIGCGFGRITKLIVDNFQNIERYTAVDLSPDQVVNAKKYVGNERVEYMVGPVQDLKLPSDSFDLVLASEVLMHIPFSDIEKVIGQMVRISRRSIVNIDWYQQLAGTEAGGYCFVHDYEKLYAKMGCKVESVEIKRRPIYIAQFSWDMGLSFSKTHPVSQKIWHAVKKSGKE